MVVVVVATSAVVVVVGPPDMTAAQSSAVWVAPAGTLPFPSSTWTVPLPSFATQMPYRPWLAGDCFSHGPSLPVPWRLGAVAAETNSSPPGRAAFTPVRHCAEREGGRRPRV